MAESTKLTPGGPGSLWVTTSEANTYFETRYGASEYWNVSVDKQALLVTAQNQIQYSGLFDWPDEVEDAQKWGVCEQVLFLLKDPTGIEARANLQAQGVREAGIVKEKYAGGDAHPIAPQAMNWLRSYIKPATNTFAIDR